MKVLFALLLALPPLAQSTREIQAILSDKRTYESLGSAEQIQEVRKTETGYLITTRNYELQIDLHYQRGTKLAGPVPFELEYFPKFDLRTGQIEK
jgi:hypothetical protein